MKRVAVTVRCVPRYGYADTEVRLIDVDLPPDAEPTEWKDALDHWFAARGIADAVYDIDVDDDGYFAIVNDEAYDNVWGTPLL